MPLITDSEMEDFEAAILEAGFEVDDFTPIGLRDEPTAIHGPTTIEQFVLTGTVTIHRKSTDEVITYRAGSGSIWPQAFAADLQGGKFGQP